MAQIKLQKRTRFRKRTSIGNSGYSRPKNKSRRRNWKKYAGQGK